MGLQNQLSTRLYIRESHSCLHTCTFILGVFMCHQTICIIVPVRRGLCKTNIPTPSPTPQHPVSNDKLQCVHNV
ncbi:uncharacterized protein LY89DRAFT_220766 [Mollisia scopiformis]|uniref:Uncharacterized protein n=1 Tax=Mollisia scopiformis TaxID=149040 RepID=A0A194WWV3_MOLSC|nr:uncharacterized protein LY89DRAFT_220766 [Mollisia scopiformis]KUJ12067.1 hypothetical protein LY89DRAFT_220766 [Mollisia scopiformis]